MLDVYEDVCRELLAVPVVKGIKSATERFAGADETFTIEALMQNGWALQSGTSHFLGQVHVGYMSGTCRVHVGCISITCRFTC